MDKPISRGKFNAGHGLLLALLAVGLFFLSWYFFQLSFAYRYLQIDRFIAAIIFTSVFAYFLIKGLAGHKAVDIYRHHLKLKWLWGLISVKLYPSGITQFGVSYTKICLRKGRTDILLSIQHINNDVELIEQLSLWQVKRRDNMRFNEFSRLESRVANILMKIVAGVGCMAVFYKSCMDFHKPISYDSLVKISGRLSKPPQIHNTSKSGYKDIDLTLNEYPSIAFQIGKAGYNTMNIPGLGNYQPGTGATLWITKDAYQKKIAQTAAPRLGERHFNWSRVETFEVELNGNKVLELDKYNKEADEIAASNKRWAFPLILVFVVIFFALKYEPKYEPTR
jgi:hypothetical protein